MQSTPVATPVLPKRSQRFLTVVTPKTIPKFVIPPRRPGPPGNPVRAGVDTGLSRECSSDSDYSSGSAMMDEYEVPSPVHDHPSHQDKSNDCGGVKTPKVGLSESDPGYTLAMTLRHLPKNYTKYGFSTLSASPKTNRKESMFFLPKANALPKLSVGARGSNLPVKVFGSTRRTHMYPDTNPSENSDEDCAEDGPLPSLRSNSNIIRRSWARKPRMRRNGVNLPSQYSDLDGYLSDQSSIERSPVLSRHATLQPNPPEEDPYNKRLLAIQELHLTCARQLYGANDQYSTDRGGIEMCLRYDRSARRLMVLLIRGENIGSKDVQFPKKVCSFVKLNIIPSPCKVQKSNILKNTCDPYYDEEFAFHDITPITLKMSYLRLQVFVEGSPSKLCLKNSTSIGEVRLKLAGVEQNGYIHIKEDLKHKKHFIAPKRVNVGLSYRANDRILTVVVVKAQNLIDSIISRGSNCCVEVQLTQVGKGTSLDTDTRQSSVIRMNNSPVFKAAFKFRLNETQNIRDGLMLVCRLIRRKPFRKSTIIGQVQYGIGSTHKSETIQWEKLLRHFGRPITQWHTLV